MLKQTYRLCGFATGFYGRFCRIFDKSDARSQGQNEKGPAGWRTLSVRMVSILRSGSSPIMRLFAQVIENAVDPRPKVFNFFRCVLGCGQNLAGQFAGFTGFTGNLGD